MCVRSKIKNSLVSHEDNVLRHTAILVNDFLVNKQFLWLFSLFIYLTHGPCNFLFYSRSRNYLKKCHFATLKNILTAITNQLKTFLVSKDALTTQGELILKEAIFNYNKIVLKNHFHYLNYASFIYRMYRRILYLTKQFFNIGYM